MSELPSTEIPPSEEPASHLSNDHLVAIIFIICVDVVASLLSLAVNSTTIAAMLTFKLYKKAPSNLFFLSLCVSDYIAGLSFLFLKICHLLILLGGRTASVLGLVTWVGSALGHLAYFHGYMVVIPIGIDRAIAIAMPLAHSRLLTTKSAKIIVLTTWTIALLTTQPIILTFALEYTNIRDLPVVVHPAQVLPPKYIAYFSTPLLTSLMISCALIYCVVIIFFFKAKKRVRANSDSSERKAQRVTRMVIAIVGVLLLCNCPVVILSTLIHPERANMFQLFMVEVFALIALLPTFINNFLYTSHIDSYKMAHLRLLPCFGGNAVGFAHSVPGH